LSKDAREGNAQRRQVDVDPSCAREAAAKQWFLNILAHTTFSVWRISA